MKNNSVKTAFYTTLRTSDENTKNNGKHKGSCSTLIIFSSEVINFKHFSQTSTITILFIKLIKVQNLTCSKFKHHKTILMLWNKIEINKSERFTQTIETKINESEHSHKQGWAFIYSHCFQRVAFRKKPSDDSVTQNLEISYHSCRQEVNFKEN